MEEKTYIGAALSDIEQNLSENVSKRGFSAGRFISAHPHIRPITDHAL